MNPTAPAAPARVQRQTEGRRGTVSEGKLNLDHARLLDAYFTNFPPFTGGKLDHVSWDAMAQRLEAPTTKNVQDRLRDFMKNLRNFLDKEKKENEKEEAEAKKPAKRSRTGSWSKRPVKKSKKGEVEKEAEEQTDGMNDKEEDEEKVAVPGETSNVVEEDQGIEDKEAEEDIVDEEPTEEWMKYIKF